MSGQNGAQPHAATEEEEASPIFQNGLHFEAGGPSEVHQNGFHTDIRGSPEIYQNRFMSDSERSFVVRGRTHSLEIEYSEEDLEEDPEEDPQEDLEEDPKEELEEDPPEENPVEEELADESDVEECRGEQFWTDVQRYHALREDAVVRNVQEEAVLTLVRRQMRSYSRGMLTVGEYSSEFLRMIEEIPELNRDNDETNHKYVRDLGPEFAGLFDHVGEHYGSLTSRACRIESDHEWDDNPIRPFFFRRKFYPVVRDHPRATWNNPVFIHRGGANARKRVRGRPSGIVIREPSVPHQAPPGIM